MWHAWQAARDAQRTAPNIGKCQACGHEHAIPTTPAAIEYRKRNPLGGPAKMFDAIADRIRSRENYDEVLADYGVSVRK